jgi:trans-2,3-dihydro-3-hydroxyanthranilate isomerase
MRRRFFTLDVFTDRRFAGNPLAVVLEPDGLDTAAMQAIAREFNHPETVFVFPPGDAAHRAALRIFTPGAELPFAGHPTVGTAVLLGRLDGGAGAREIVVEEKVGPVRCRVEPIDEHRGRATFTIPKLPEETRPAAATETVAAALGISPGDIGFDSVAPSCWSAGNPFTFVPVRGLEAIGRCRPDMAHWSAAFDAGGSGAAFIFCRETREAGNDFHARMFHPRMGIPEDPATGSAVAAFAGLLVRIAPRSDGDHAFRIEQGYEMGRPSLMALGLTLRGGKLTAATVGGHAVIVTEGAIEA